MTMWGGTSCHVLIYGARVSLIVGLLSVGVAIVIGVPLGIIAAYAGGWIDHTIMRMIDAMIAVPGLLFAMLLLLVMGGSVLTVSIALGINLFTTQARLVRSQALSVKEREYFMAARMIGTPPWRMLLFHMVPNSIQPVIVQATLGMGFAILGEAGSEFHRRRCGASHSHMGQHAQPGICEPQERTVAVICTGNLDLPARSLVQLRRRWAERRARPQAPRQVLAVYITPQHQLSEL